MFLGSATLDDEDIGPPVIWMLLCDGNPAEYEQSSAPTPAPMPANGGHTAGTSGSTRRTSSPSAARAPHSRGSRGGPVPMYLGSKTLDDEDIEWHPSLRSHVDLLGALLVIWTLLCDGNPAEYEQNSAPTPASMPANGGHTAGTSGSTRRTS